VFRTAQEAVRNVLSHARARSVRVSLGRPDTRCVELTVSDDGRGFEPSEVATRARDGHLGVELLARLAEDAGGSLAVESTPGRGTTLRLRVPA
jgi:two-component system NarL family sensor kinase